MFSERMINDLKDHVVWKQIEQDVEERIALLKEELSVMDLQTDLVMACRHQGRIDGMLFVTKALDDYALERKVQDIEKKEREEAK
jgi:hypothetical protein